MSKRVTGLNDGLSYLGVEALTPPNLVVRVDSPTPADSQNVNLGEIWLRKKPNFEIWMLVSLSETGITGNAKWVQLYPGASLALGPGVVQVDAGNTFFSDFGTDGQILISDTAGLPVWANIISSDMSITVTNGANSIDITTIGGGGLSTFHTDSGDATVAGTDITIAGGDNINTSGAGSTVTVNLDTSVLQPDTNAVGDEGIYALGATSYTADRFLHNFGTDNTFLGHASGNLTLTTSIQNVGLGTDVLQSLTTGDNNVIAGYRGGDSITTGSANVGAGRLVFDDLTTGSNNIALGDAGFSSLVTGSGNLGLGFGVGANYTGAESYNILIGNDGVLGESNVIRIGTTGVGAYQQEKLYVAATYLTATGSGDKGVVFCDVDGQLGTGPAPSDYQVLTGNTGGSPNWYTIGSSGGSVTITQDNGLGTINFEAAGVAALTALDDDLGNVATPAAGIITMSDLANLTVSAAVNTVSFKLNDSILQPNTSVSGNSGVYALGSTFPFDYITDRFLHNYGTQNTFLGYQAGRINAGLTGTQNIGIGNTCLDAITTGGYNIGIGGLNTLSLCTTGQHNIALGTSSMGQLSTALRNIGIGYQSLGQVGLGTGPNATYDTIAIGYQACRITTYARESVLIGNGIADSVGTAVVNGISIGHDADSGTDEIHIGSLSGQSDCYVAGIYNSAAGSTPGVTFCSANRKLHSSIGTNGNILMTGGGQARWGSLTSTGTTISITNPTSTTINLDLNAAAYLAFFAYIPSNIANVTGDGSTYYFGRNAAMTEVYDSGNDFFPGTGGTGAASEAVFTAPVPGVYYFTMSVYATNLVTPPVVVPADPLSIVTIARTYSLINCIFTNQGTQSYGFAAQANMAAGDTCKFTWSLFWGDGTKTRGIGATHSWCAGFLVPA